MITTQQQIDFIAHFRQHIELYGNESLIVSALAKSMPMTPERVALYLTAIHASLLGVKLWEVANVALVCEKCNRPLPLAENVGDTANPICKACKSIENTTHGNA